MDLPEEVKNVLGDRNPESWFAIVKYKNYRGEVANRKIIPLSFKVGSTEYHREEQLLLEVWDLEKNAFRTYAVKDIQSWVQVPG